MRWSLNIVAFNAVLACTAPLVSGFESGSATFLRTSPPLSLIASRPSHTSSRISLPGLLSMSVERPLGRREALAALTAASAFLQSTPAQAAYVGEPPSIFSQLQGGIQGTLQPGHWLGQFIGINSHKEVWEFDASPEQVSKAMTAALKEITPKYEPRHHPITAPKAITARYPLRFPPGQSEPFLADNAGLWALRAMMRPSMRLLYSIFALHTSGMLMPLPPMGV